MNVYSLTVVGVFCALSSMSYADTGEALDREKTRLVCPSDKKFGILEYTCPNGKGDLLGCWATKVACLPLDREPNRHCPPGEQPGPAKYFCPNGANDPLGCWSVGVNCVPQSLNGSQVTFEQRENQGTPAPNAGPKKPRVIGIAISKGRR